MDFLENKHKNNTELQHSSLGWLKALKHSIMSIILYCYINLPLTKIGNYNIHIKFYVAKKLPDRNTFNISN